jgi:hypothetical protein
MSKFYAFRQNNSGGGFDFDEDSGITTTVIIEAESADDANRRLEAIGGYFNGTNDYGPDCRCCGDRWHAVSEYDGADVPSVYGKPVLFSDELDSSAFAVKWQGEDRPEIFVHYLDGRIVGCNG